MLSSNWTLVAYIDPGAGSMLLQILAAGLLSAAFALKLSWHYVRNSFRGTLYRLSNEPSPDDDEPG
jgi:hypothetical protein